MNKNLFDHVNIDKARTFVPDGTEPDSKVACAKYNAIIDSVGGIDLQLLGIGGNGHIEICIHHGYQEHHVSQESSAAGKRKEQSKGSL